MGSQLSLKIHPVPIVWTQKPVWIVRRRGKKRPCTCRDSSTGPSSLVIIPTTTFRLLIYSSVCHCLFRSKLNIFMFLFLLLFFESFFYLFSSPLFLRCFLPSLSASSISSLHLFKVRRKRKGKPALRQDPTICCGMRL